MLAPERFRTLYTLKTEAWRNLSLDGSPRPGFLEHDTCEQRARYIGRNALAIPAPQIPPSLDEELISIRHKRALLDRLITFTRHVHQLAGSFDVLKEMTKPSQRPSKRYLKVLLDAMQRYEDEETYLLQEQLKEIDQRIQQRLQGMIALSMMREADFLKLLEAKGDNNANYTRIHSELKSFEDLLQQNLAIRYVLDKRGAMIKSCRLPISQEDIRGHAERLKKEEAACKKRVEDKITSLIQDTEHVLARPDLPPELKNQLQNVRDNLSQKLVSLTKTESMETAIAALEEFDLDAPIHEKIEQAKKGNKKRKGLSIANSTKTNTEQKKPEKVTGIKAFVRWLNTPWHVSYEEVAKEEDATNNDDKPQA